MTGVFELPYGFWLSGLIIIGLSLSAWKQRHEGIGFPVLAVYGTVLMWYHCDALYNKSDFVEAGFRDDVVDAAWWQVTGFCISFAVLSRFVVRFINRRVLNNPCVSYQLVAGRAFLTRVQSLFGPTLVYSGAVWAGLTVIALLRTDFDWEGLFFPWLGHLAYPWSRGQLGGSTGFLIAAASYVSMLCLALFGILAVLSFSPTIQWTSIFLCFISWPSVLFDRTRSSMLMVVFPAILAFIGIRLARRFVLQILVSAAALLLIGSWFKFVMAHRTTMSIAMAWQQNQTTLAEKHEGLNMFLELCWMNTFIEDGRYAPNWGYRYFADAVNIVPRAIWADKPTIGIEYAIVRGSSSGSGGNLVATTFSTGMIGGGVDNFGPWLGPPASAFLMTLWVAFLVRLDLTGNRFGRLPLFLLGLATIPLLGRDITPMAMFPTLFGFALVWLAEREMGREPNRQPRNAYKYAFRTTGEVISAGNRHNQGRPSMNDATLSFEELGNVDAPRTTGHCEHLLTDILTITILAVTCGADNWTDVAVFGQVRQDWLRQFLDLPAGIPSEDTFRRVFALLEHNQFAVGLLQWMRVLQEATCDQVVAIDGHVLSRSHSEQGGLAALRLVMVKCTENGLALSLYAKDEKSNEITAIPELLKLFNLTGCTVIVDVLQPAEKVETNWDYYIPTTDYPEGSNVPIGANSRDLTGCLKKIAAAIRLCGADYVLAVAENQPELCGNLQQHFDQLLKSENSLSDFQHCETDQSTLRSNERRYYYYSSPVAESLKTCKAWCDIESLDCIVTKTIREGQETNVVQYYISNQEPNAKRLAHSVRGLLTDGHSLGSAARHFEKSDCPDVFASGRPPIFPQPPNQHWVLYIAFREGGRRQHERQSLTNLERVRNLAVNLLHQDKSIKRNPNTKRMIAGLDPIYLIRLLHNARL